MFRAAPGLITIPRFTDHRGSLSVIDWTGCLPFSPKRFYYLYDIPGGATRSGHAHWIEHEVMLAVHGSFTVRIDDGSTSRKHQMDRPDRGLLVPAGWWHELYDFQGGAVCAVFASEAYDPEDYCRDYQNFVQSRGRQLS